MRIPKSHILSLAVAAVCALISSCSGTSSSISVDDELLRATKALNTGSYATAQNICTGIAESDAKLSAKELCQLSILYIRLSEQINDDDNTSAALKCFRTAIEQAPDSITEFFAGLSHEDLQYAVLLSNITSSVIAAESGQVLAVSADIDSLFMAAVECDSVPMETPNK